MTTLTHPHMDMPVEVPADQVEAWTAQGWLTDEPADTPKTSPATGEGKKKEGVNA